MTALGAVHCAQCNVKIKKGRVLASCGQCFGVCKACFGLTFDVPAAEGLARLE